MDYQLFGFEQFNRERRKFAGRRLGQDRRSVEERRHQQRRIQLTAVVIERRSGAERRLSDDRRLAERRGMDDRRHSVWTMLEGGTAS